METFGAGSFRLPEFGRWQRPCQDWARIPWDLDWVGNLVLVLALAMVLVLVCIGVRIGIRAGFRIRTGLGIGNSTGWDGIAMEIGLYWLRRIGWLGTSYLICTSTNQTQVQTHVHVYTLFKNIIENTKT